MQHHLVWNIALRRAPFQTHSVDLTPKGEADLSKMSGGILHPNLTALFQPPVRHRREQVQHSPPFVEEHVTQQQGVVAGPGRMGNGIAPGESAAFRSNSANGPCGHRKRFLRSTSWYPHFRNKFEEKPFGRRSWHVRVGAGPPNPQ